MKELTEKQVFMITKTQKKTLDVLHKKYKINASKFIRDAINEKLQRDKDGIFSKFVEVEKYLEKFSEVPF